MKVYLHEIKENEKTIQVDEKFPWAIEALRRVDEASDEDFGPDTSLPRPPGVAAPERALRERVLNAQFDLRRVDEVFLVSGRIASEVQLYCSRCGKAYSQYCEPRFSALFCQDPEMAGIPSKGNVQHPVVGHANTLRTDLAGESSEDVEITYLEQDFIDLGDILTEQIQLQVPFQPLCMNECKGVCAQCGTDLNESRCACDKLVKTSPFSVLRDFDVKRT